MKKLIIIIALMSGCSDGERSKLASWATGNDARITCHSGGKVIFDGCSTGKVNSEQGSDGYYFRDKVTGRLVEVSGECFLDYEAPCPITSIRPGQ